MCDTCLIESVKQSMLSRRALFTGAAATTAAVMASGLTTARPALAQAAGRVVDLTHAYDGAFPTFDGNPGILYEPAVKFEGNGYQLRTLSDGSTHEVLKNFPNEAEFRTLLAGCAQDIGWQPLTYFWALSYTLN